MENEFDDLPPELKAALNRMLEQGTDREAAYRTIRRENEIWPAVQRMMKEVRDNPKGAPIEYNELSQMIQRDLQKSVRGLPFRTDDVDAVVNDTLLTVLRKRDKFDPALGTFLVWVKQIARGQAKRPQYPLWMQQPAPDPAPSQVPNVAATQHCQLPPPEAYEELLRLIQERQVHFVLAFLFHKYLEWKPAEIADELGDKSICELAGFLVSEVKRLVPSLKDPDNLFRRLQSTACSQEHSRLCDHYESRKPNEAVVYWSEDVRRWIWNRVQGSSKKLLKGVCELRAAAHEQLTFLWLRLLQCGVSWLVSAAERSLLLLVNDFCAGLAKETRLSAHDISESVSRLRDAVTPKVGVPEKTLKECSRGNLVSDLETWRDRVQRMIAKKLKGWGAVAYAYLCGALPGLPARGGVA